MGGTEPQVLIRLRGGPVVSLAALQLAWSLEARAFKLAVADDGMLIVSPRASLTADDDRAIRAHRDQLVMLVAHSETVQ